MEPFYHSETFSSPRRNCKEQEILLPGNPFPEWQSSTVSLTAIRSHREKYSEEQGLFLPKPPKAHYLLENCWSPVCVKMADSPEHSLRVSFPKNCKTCSYWTSYFWVLFLLINGDMVHSFSMPYNNPWSAYTNIFQPILLVLTIAWFSGFPLWMIL